MRRILAALLILLMALPVARGESAAQLPAEMYLYEQPRPIFHQDTAEIMSLFGEGDKAGAYDLILEKHNALNRKYPFEEWDGALCYTSPEELALYRALRPDERLSQTYNDYPALLYCLGFLLVDDQRYEDARACLEVTWEMNPVSMAVAVELTSCYLAQGDLASARALLEEARPLCLLPCDYGWYYRRLGYILCEEGDYSLAKSCQLYSLIFEESENAYGELTFLDATMGLEPFDYRRRGAGRDRLTEEAVFAVEDGGLKIRPGEAQMAVLAELDDQLGSSKYNVYGSAMTFFRALDAEG